MQSFLKHKAKRWGYDGWALRHRESTVPVLWTVCTTRDECRKLKKEYPRFEDFLIVKVKIRMEHV